MRAVGRIFFGEMPAEFEGHISSINVGDKVALYVMSGIMILIGVFPSAMAPLVQTGADAVLRLVGGA